MSKNSKTKMLKKGIYTPANAHAAAAAPTKKVEYTSNPENKGTISGKKQEQEARAHKRVERRKDELRKDILTRRGVDPKELDKENTIVILCLANGSFTIQDGVREKVVRKRDTSHKVVSEKTIELPNILHGTRAIEHMLREKFKQKVTFLSIGNNHVFIRTATEDRNDVVEALTPTGRISIYKKDFPKKEPKEPKKPSNNKEGGKKAKIERKEANIANHDMKPYYAARRKMNHGVPIDKCVSLRIRRHNKKLADDIKAWLIANNKDNGRKGTGKGPHWKYRGTHTPSNNIPSAQIKLSKRLKSAKRTDIRLKELKATEALKMALNQTRRAKTKLAKGVQTELKEAA